METDMAGIFDQNNPFNDVMTKIFNIMFVNLLCLVCMLPVFTAGASITAMYYVTLKMVKDEETSVSKAFFYSFRQNFKESLPLTLIMFLAGGLVALNLHLSRGETKGYGLMYGLSLALALFVCALFTYVWPHLAHFENSVGQILNDSWRMSLAHFPSTVLMVAVNIAPFLVFLLWPKAFVKIVWIWVFFGTGLSAYINSFFLRRIFSKYEKEAQ